MIKLLLILLTAVIIIIPIIETVKYKIFCNIIKSERKTYDTVNETSSEIKGNTGEYIIYNQIKNIDIGYKKILRNIYIYKNEYETTEIDMIIIHATGIYIIESKNYSGWIFGKEQSQKWTQSMKNGIKYKFQNPIIQNRKHINTLKRYLNLDEDLYTSLIIFGMSAQLKNIHINRKNLKVITVNELSEEIKRAAEYSYKKLTIQDINDIYNTIAQAAVKETDIKEKHKLQINHNS